jgi:hypothetical protein
MFGQDGGNLAVNGGARLYAVQGKSIGMVGAFLGTVSSTLVSTSVAWVGSFNLDQGVELDTLSLANGTLTATQSPNLLNQIDSKGYNFLVKYVGVSGSYFNNDYTCISSTSDYNCVTNNRTIHKVARQTRAAELANLAAPIYFNTDGTISPNSIAFYASVCKGVLTTMQSAGEISQFAVVINPKQNVVSTKNLAISVMVVPTGTANQINITLGFVVNI